MVGVVAVDAEEVKFLAPIFLDLSLWRVPAVPYTFPGTFLVLI